MEKKSVTHVQTEVGSSLTQEIVESRDISIDEANKEVSKDYKPRPTKGK